MSHSSALTIAEGDEEEEEEEGEREY